MIAITTVIEEKALPVILFKYKPVVDSRSDTVNQDHLMEVLIKAFHCMFHCNVDSNVHCLTDLIVWHYFKFLRRDEHLDTEWSHTIIDTWHSRPTVKRLLLYMYKL